MMLSSHLCLGLPLGLVVKGFHLNIFLSAMVSGILTSIKPSCFVPSLRIFSLHKFSMDE